MKFDKILNHINRKVNLSDTEESNIVAKLKPRRYLKGQYIIREGDVSTNQTFILSGKVRTFYLDNKGNEHIVSFGIEDWWVGDICSFTTQRPAEFNSQCLEITEVVQISYDDMERLYRDVPKLERYFRIIIQSAYGKMTKRIVQNHSLPAIERYILFTESYPEIAQRVPQYMIASYLGITKEFLSMIRKQLSIKAKS